MHRQKSSGDKLFHALAQRMFGLDQARELLASPASRDPERYRRGCRGTG